MGRRRRRGEAQGRAQGRVRGRIREGGQRSRPQGQASRGAGAGRNRATLDVDAIESYANRLSSQLGGSSRSSGGPRLTGGSGLAGAASGLAGAASGLAGGSLASRLTGGGRSDTSEDFENEVRERLDLMDERLQRLEEEMLQLRGGEGTSEDLTEPSDPETGP